MALSKIEWTETTWNPITGCNKVSPGCKNCYAEILSKRLHAMGIKKYENGFNLALHPQELKKPTQWNKPKMIFVNSMSDLFHEKVPDEFIFEVFHIMNTAIHHTFQVLTKRDRRLLELNASLNWTSNIWMGVSVENQDYISRIDNLKLTDAAIKFVSFEPLLGEISDVNLDGIDWAIIGGESGPKSRPIEEVWVDEIHSLCNYYNVKFFFKQWGGKNKKKTGRKLHGKTYDAYPTVGASY